MGSNPILAATDQRIYKPTPSTRESPKGPASTIFLPPAQELPQMTTPTPSPGTLTPDLHEKRDRVRRAFEAAFQRMCAATTVDVLEDELSNLLHHLYRLGELCRWRLGPPGEQLGKKEFGERLRTSSDDLRVARAAMWVRNDDTHNLFVEVTAPAAMADLWPGYWTNMWGVLAWQPLLKIDPAGRHKDYADTLEGRSVLGTTRGAFDAMAALL
jgi:hypothetical protein